MKSVTSRSNPIVAQFRELAAAADPAGARLLLDGTHLIREALDAGLSFESVAVATALLDADGDEAHLARTLHEGGHPVVAVTEPVLRAMSPVRQPSGMVAIALRPAVPERPLLAGARAFFLVVADVQDPGNLGALVRVAEAGGVSQVVVCGKSAHPYGWKALRGSMGSALRLPIVQFATLDDALESLAASGTRTVAAVPRHGRSPDELPWTGRVAVVLGGEGTGLTSEQLERCDDRVTIPMSPPVESLNVAVAGAILVYAARRQRT